MTKRKIARTLGINRKSVDRHLAGAQSKGATVEEALTGEAPTGSETLDPGSEAARKDKRFSHVANALGTAIRSLLRSSKG